MVFQSTRPAWGATCLIRWPLRSWRCFNPRALRGARRRLWSPWPAERCFNPRALRGARPCPIKYFSPNALFQSTRPAWGATQRRCGQRLVVGVSIHAPCVGRDPNLGRNPLRQDSFNPRALRGARPWVRGTRRYSEMFQSTRPAWGATALRGRRSVLLRVSIHAPCVGRDWPSKNGTHGIVCFNPRALRGARREDVNAPQ